MDVTELQDTLPPRLREFLADDSKPWIFLKGRPDEDAEMLTTMPGPHETTRMLAITLHEIVRQLPAEPRTHAAALIVMQFQRLYDQDVVTNVVEDLVAGARK